MDSKSTRREVSEILLAMAVSVATDEQRARLSHLVTSDDKLALHAVQLLYQEASLAQLYSDERDGTVFTAMFERAGEKMEGLRRDGAAPSTIPLPVGGRAPSSASAPKFHPFAAWRSPLGWLAAAALLLTGTILGSVATRWLDDSRQVIVDAGGTNSETREEKPQDRYVAKFVHETACIWEPGHKPPIVGARHLRGGESFNLMEGLAEIDLSFATAGNATLWMEGPARMILTSDGTPSLSQGRFTSRVFSRNGDVTFEMPFGQVRVLGETSLGVTVNGLDVEVHVFSGDVSIACPWLPTPSTSDQVAVESGKCVRFVIEEGRTAMHWDTAKPWQFASQSTINADQLQVPTAYVDDVLAASPVVYWRFEDPATGKIANEVGDRYQGTVHGVVGWSQQGSNQVIEFGLGSQADATHSFIEIDEPFEDELKDGYTLEAWVKPSHYHLGSIVSMFRDQASHGALVELGGLVATPSLIEHTGQFRYLHRDPPSDVPELGTSCFSDIPYEARRWAHVVAVKDAEGLKFYINGSLAASAVDTSNLASGMTFLVGQLDRQRHYRAFIGQLDELVVYRQPLDVETIERHYRLIRTGQLRRDEI